MGSDFNLADTDAVIDYFVAEINKKTSHTITASRISSKLRLSNSSSSVFRITWNRISLISLRWLGASTYAETKRTALLPGSYVNLAILYTDEYGREGRCQISSSSQLYIPLLSELSGTARNVYNVIRYSVAHLAPSWAKHWQLMYGGSSIENYYALPISPKASLLYPDTDIEFHDDYMYIDINKAVERYNSNKNNKNSIKTFEAAIGDKIRFPTIFTYSGVVSGIDLNASGAGWDEDEKGINYRHYRAGWQLFIRMAA